MSDTAGVTGPCLPTAVRLLLAGLLGAAALVHVALAPEHYTEQPVFGVFFALAGALQFAIAIALGRPRGPSWRLLRLLRLVRAPSPRPCSAC